jgi:hypothetical protein
MKNKIKSNKKYNKNINLIKDNKIIKIKLITFN